MTIETSNYFIYFTPRQVNIKVKDTALGNNFKNITLKHPCDYNLDMVAAGDIYPILPMFGFYVREADIGSRKTVKSNNIKAQSTKIYYDPYAKFSFVNSTSSIRFELYGKRKDYQEIPEEGGLIRAIEDKVLHITLDEFEEDYPYYDELKYWTYWIFKYCKEYDEFVDKNDLEGTQEWLFEYMESSKGGDGFDYFRLNHTNEEPEKNPTGFDLFEFNNSLYPASGQEALDWIPWEYTKQSYPKHQYASDWHFWNVDKNDQTKEYYTKQDGGFWYWETDTYRNKYWHFFAMEEGKEYDDNENWHWWANPSDYNELIDNTYWIIAYMLATIIKDQEYLGIEHQEYHVGKDYGVEYPDWFVYRFKQGFTDCQDWTFLTLDGHKAPQVSNQFKKKDNGFDLYGIDDSLPSVNGQEAVDWQYFEKTNQVYIEDKQYFGERFHYWNINNVKAERETVDIGYPQFEEWDMPANSDLDQLTYWGIEEESSWIYWFVSLNTEPATFKKVHYDGFSKQYAIDENGFNFWAIDDDSNSEYISGQEDTPWSGNIVDDMISSL